MQISKEQERQIYINSITERLVLEYITPYLVTFEPKYISNPFGKDGWDCTFYSGASTNCFVSVCELKVKEKYSVDSFKSVLIKENKYHSLQQTARSNKAIANGTQPIYINIYKDGLVAFNLKDFPPALMKWVEKDWPRFENDWSNTRKEWIGELGMAKAIEKIKIEIPIAELKKQATAIYSQYHSTYPKHVPYFHIQDAVWKKPKK